MHSQITNWESKRRNKIEKKKVSKDKENLLAHQTLSFFFFFFFFKSNPLIMTIIIINIFFREIKPINLNDNKTKI